jgi:hypothetical protein
MHGSAGDLHQAQNLTTLERHRTVHLKKSQANIVNACVRRNCRQIVSVSPLGAGGTRNRAGRGKSWMLPRGDRVCATRLGLSCIPSFDSPGPCARSARPPRPRPAGARRGGDRSIPWRPRSNATSTATSRAHHPVERTYPFNCVRHAWLAITDAASRWWLGSIKVGCAPALVH